MRTCLPSAVDLRAIPLTWQRPTAPRQGGSGSDRDCGGVRASLLRCDSPSGGRRDRHVGPPASAALLRSCDPETCRVRGGERPRLAPLDLVSGLTCGPWFAWFVAAAHPRVLLDLRPGRRRAQCAVSWFGSTHDSDLRPSDSQKPPPDRAGHGGTLLLTSTDASGRYVLMLDVGGCSGR